MITAARILAEVASIERFRTDARLAIYAGAAPLDASSAQTPRTGSTAPATDGSTARSTRSRSPRSASTRPPRPTWPAAVREGKTVSEAIRALKRHLIRVIYRLLTGHPAAAPTPIGAMHPTPMT